MDLSPRRARPDALAPAPPPLRLLQPWAPAAVPAASAPLPGGWLRRLRDRLVHRWFAATVWR